MSSELPPPVTVIFSKARWQPVIPPRQLTTWEQAALARLLTRASCVGMSRQTLLESRRVSAQCLTDLSIAFTFDPERPYVPTATTHGHYGGEQMVAELNGQDRDGMEMWILLFVRDGRPLELDIQRADGSPFTALPDLDMLELY